MSMVINPYQIVPSVFTADSADFDGTNDLMKKGSDLSGNADGKSGIFSGFARIDGGAGATHRFITASQTLGTAADDFQIQHQFDNKMSIIARRADTNILLSLSTTAIYPPAATWYHVLISWDLAAGVSHFYVNDVSNQVVTARVNDTIKYTAGDWAVGGDSDNGVKMNGCLAELYFAPNQFLDFSVVANRRKFLLATGKAAPLGTNGSLPTGVAPLVYLHLDDMEAVANFAINRGSGGGPFNITGTLDTGSTSPTD
jgi:hypothetical protein